MKKALVIVACVALVGAFTSCNKKCTCTTYPAQLTVEMELEQVQNTYKNAGIDIKKCSDMNNVATVSGVKTGVECK